MALTSCVVCNGSDPELPSSGESHKLRKLLSEILNLVVEDNDASIMICKECNIALVAAHEYYRKYEELRDRLTALYSRKLHEAEPESVFAVATRGGCTQLDSTAMSFENKAGIQGGTEGPEHQRALLSSPMESDDVCNGNVEQLASIFDELETSNSGDAEASRGHCTRSQRSEDKLKVAKQCDTHSKPSPLKPIDNPEECTTVTRHSCHHCYKNFRTSSNLGSHLAAAHIEEKDVTNRAVLQGHSCTTCGKEVATRAELHSHMKTHNTEKLPHVCSVCGKGFRHVRLLQEHGFEHSSDRGFACSQKSLSKSSPQKHYSKHSGMSVHTCEYCGRLFAHAHMLKYHIRTHTGDRPHVCSHCGKTFTRPSYLAQHLEIHPGDHDFTCSVCDRKFLVKAALKRHSIVHTGGRRHLCSTCGKSFSRSNQLNAHMRNHVRDKPHQCGQCPSRFPDPGSLKVHMRIHTGERPYTCNICAKTFTQVAHYNVHRRVHTGERPYKCETCGASFSFGGHYQNHLRIHTGQKPFKCTECSACFSAAQYLRIHSRIHTGEKPSKCQICQKAFTQAGSLKRHLRIHTGERPYNCSICGTSFARSETMERHRKAHNEQEQKLEKETSEQEVALPIMQQSGQLLAGLPQLDSLSECLPSGSQRHVSMMNLPKQVLQVHDASVTHQGAPHIQQMVPPETPVLHVPRLNVAGYGQQDTLYSLFQ